MRTTEVASNQGDDAPFLFIRGCALPRTAVNCWEGFIGPLECRVTRFLRLNNQSFWSVRMGQRQSDEAKTLEEALEIAESWLNELAATFSS